MLEGMNVITRNFLRLLRAGSFQEPETIEPLSAWKWRQLYQIALMHGMGREVLEGIRRCQDQFFVQLPEGLAEEWQKAVDNSKEDYADTTEDLLRADHLTNPLLNRRLQNILDDETSANTETRHMLLQIVKTARYFMNEGFPFRHLTDLGLEIRRASGRVDYAKLKEWISALRLTQFARLQGTLLVSLMKFTEEEIQFATPDMEIDLEAMARHIFKLRKVHAGDWQFSQGQSIFVHSSGSMLWHVQRSTRCFKYYPAESFTNFVASFIHSISHIEE